MQPFVEAHLREDVKLNDEEIADLVSRCEIRDVEFNGVVTCAILLAGNEIHLIADPRHRGHAGSRRLVRDTFRALLEEKVFLTTRIPVDTPRRDRTGERMGFEHTWSDGRFDYYILTEVPYGKGEQRCQQSE